MRFCSRLEAALATAATRGHAIELMSEPRRRGLVGTLLSRSSELTQKEVEAVCHWLKQVIALAFGLVCGILPITGGSATLAFVLITLFVNPAAIRFMTRDDPNRFDIEAEIELLKEGVGPAIGTFLLTWIVMFTLIVK